MNVTVTIPFDKSKWESSAQQTMKRLSGKYWRGKIYQELLDSDRCKCPTYQDWCNENAPKIETVETIIPFSWCSHQKTAQVVLHGRDY